MKTAPFTRCNSSRPTEERYLSGSRKRGCFHLIGEIKSSGKVLIAEGHATAASLYEATGLTVTVACDS